MADESFAGRTIDDMTERKPDSDWNLATAFALLGQLGLTVAIPIVLGGVVGKYLDTLLHAHGVVLLLMILLGIAAGAYGAYLLLAKELNWKP
jgi:predicted F0F1-ATPase subunit